MTKGRNDYAQLEAIKNRVIEINIANYKYGGECMICQWGSLGSDGEEDGKMHDEDCPIAPYEKSLGWSRVYDENGYTNISPKPGAIKKD